MRIILHLDVVCFKRPNFKINSKHECYEEIFNQVDKNLSRSSGMNKNNDMYLNLIFEQEK